MFQKVTKLALVALVVLGANAQAVKITVEPRTTQAVATVTR